MRRIRNLILFTILTMTIALTFTFAWLCWQQALQFVDVPQMVNNLTPADYGIENYEEVTLITEDNLRLRAWYVAPNREDGTTIIFLHGHGGHINDLIPDTNMGYGALLFDFRGHGASDDTVVTMGINEVMDVQAGINFLLDQSAVNPERIALYGNSMGASVALLSAQQIPEIRVVIADAPYSSIYDALVEELQSYIQE